jgi:predicted nucleic acid-binding protein
LKLVFDSDILIDHFRSGDLHGSFAAAIDRSEIYMSSVVAMELRAGCKRPGEIGVLERFLRPFEVSRRIVAPDHRACVQAGAVLGALGAKLGLTIEKRREMGNDVLIATSALSIGAAVITRNRSDFSLISRCLPVVWYGSVEKFLAAAGYG